MKKFLKVSLKQLKQELSHLTAEAASGVTVEVTRYNKPFLRLVRTTESDIFVGKNSEKSTLKPLSGIKSSDAKGSIVAALLKDRS